MNEPVRVDELERRGWLRVEDGNHGEQRPRPSEFGSGSRRFIRAADMDGGRVLFESAELINDVALARIRKGIGAPGDILFSHKGTVGKLALVPLDAPAFVCSPQTTFWRSLDADRIDQPFLYHYLHSNEFSDQWRARKGETDMADYVSLTAQRELMLRLPNIKVQRAIAGLLGTIDDKVNLNHEMNRRLEDLASALFKSWFVDFDPVVAKRDGKTPVGVPADALHLFPSHFEDCALGPIPTGWTAGRVDDQFSVVMGQSPPGSTYNETGEGLPFYQGRTDFGFRFPTRRVYCTAPTRMAEPMDALISVRAPVGDVNMAAERCAIGRGVAAVRHKAGRSSFGYYAMQSLRDEFDVYESEGTLFGAIGGADFRSLHLTYPSEQVLDCFESIARPLDDQIALNEQESTTLATLRDILLPRLISGVITLKVAEKTVAEVV